MSDFYTMNESENNINYYKNILTLIFGSGLSHIIPFLLTPILTRLYSTSEYGLFGFFISLIAISTMISTGRYHLAILLPKDENESNCIKFISITLSLLFCTLLTILIYVFFKLNLFGSLFAKTQNLIFFLPLATLSFSLFDITNYTLNRNGQYKDMSFARIFRSFSREVLSIIFGIYTWGAKGLILGSILGNVIPVAIYRNKIFNNLSHDLDNAKVILKKHGEPIEYSDLIEFGPIKLNLDAHEVLINDDEVILTALEFKLLKHLIQRRGRVQTRDQLLGDVWGYSSEVTTRTVDTHIKRLREKLGQVGNYIQTIRGVGYRLNNQT